MSWPDVIEFLYITLGVLAALAWPWLRSKIKTEPAGFVALSPWGWIKKGVWVGLFSLVTGFILLAVLKASNNGAAILWYTGFLGGFAWESTMEKLLGKGT